MEEQKTSEQLECNMREEQDKIYIDLVEGKPTPDIESLCMSCQQMGITKFMLTKIPFFKEVMVSSFSCEHCGFKNSEISFAGKLEDYGVRYELNCINNIAFERTVVKSEFATIKIPECGLEMPPQTQKGSIKTIEGFFLSTIEGLQSMQEERRKFDPATADRIDEYCKTLDEFRRGERMPFTFILEDPSGNSYIQNPSAPTRDHYCVKTKWVRTVEDYEKMGYPVDQATLQAEQDKLKDKDPNAPVDYFNQKKGQTQTKEEQEELLARAQKHSAPVKKEAVAKAGYVDFSRSVEDQEELPDGDPRKEVMKFPVPCYNCDKEGNVQMCFSSIPFFKEIIIMAFICDYCGYRNSEIKEGGGISEKAKRITLQVTEQSDLSRDLFKSDTAKFCIKEIGFDMEPGSMGSMYTTVEGLLSKLIEELTNNNPFGQGDSAMDKKYLDFLDRLEKYKDGREPFTLELDDPSDNCFVYNPFAPEEDPKIKVEIYERTEEQNDELGITHMNV